MALVGNEDISVSISNTFLHSYGLVDDLQRFLGRSSVPLNNIQGIIIDAASDAKVSENETVEVVLCFPVD